jgi:hypothetical protein
MPLDWKTITGTLISCKNFRNYHGNQHDNMC